ncbi:universal stress protein [Streptomyces sp. KLOTTS4A1]|uniref:universal stress protein n=1 Tax=Streptomyces sp. KLOTTS4A1 TaxID=3390996 RepID=UPI0039F475D7
MTKTITVGLDGSLESRAAADWAAGEAKLRGLPVKLVQVWESVPERMAQDPLLDAETHRHWTERVLREATERLRQHHPEVEVSIEQVGGSPAQALADAAKDADMLVLGSRGLGRVSGFLVGSVSLSALALTDRPVVVVRAAVQPTDRPDTEPTDTTSGAKNPRPVLLARPVLLGLDIGHPNEELIDFAFRAAAFRRVPLRVVHGWYPPAYYAYGVAPAVAATEMVAQSDAAAMAEVLRPWQRKHPDVEIVTESHCSSPSLLLIEGSRDASLVVVGRRIRHSPLGFHIGSVTHAVLHHAAAPVAVVAHD